MPSVRQFDTRAEAVEFADHDRNAWMLSDEFVENGVGASILNHALDPASAEDGFGVLDENGTCDRCAFVALHDAPEPLNRIYAELVPVLHVYVTTGRYVVHFRLCLNCAGHYACLADHVIRTTFVAGERVEISMTE